jgi:hypothetical protein
MLVHVTGHRHQSWPDIMEEGWARVTEGLGASARVSVDFSLCITGFSRYFRNLSNTFTQNKSFAFTINSGCNINPLFKHTKHKHIHKHHNISLSQQHRSSSNTPFYSIPFEVLTSDLPSRSLSSLASEASSHPLECAAKGISC